jgi:hypothetical protein
MGAVDGMAYGRGHAARRILEAMSEAWRERASERRARASTKLGAEPRVPRSRIAAAVEARLALRAGVRLDDFLRQRLAKYAGRLPLPLEALPVTVDVEGGEAVVRPRPRGRSAAHVALPETPTLARALIERDGAYAGREIRDAEHALDQLDARASAARTQLDAFERELAKALASGQLVSRPDVEATAEQLGRPPVPSAAPIHALRAFVVALLSAEAWRFSGPILAASGAAPGGLEQALRDSPIPTALALTFAVGTAAAAFTFAAAATARAAEAIAAAPDPARRRLLAATAAGAALLVAGVAAAAAAPEWWAQLALLAVVPFAAAMMWRAAGALATVRAAAAGEALRWDRDRAQEAIARGRHEEIRARAAAELQALELERAAARRRVQQLHRMAIGAERSAMLAARSEARRLDRLSEGLACALELDRYLYIRLAADRAVQPLERPARTARLERTVGAEHLGVAG